MINASNYSKETNKLTSHALVCFPYNDFFLNLYSVKKVYMLMIQNVD